MDVAPPTSGWRLQELGDRVVVFLGPERPFFGFVFLGIWLPLWTLGGCAAVLHMRESSPGEAAFLLFWLCGWLFGECAAILAVLWLSFGRELLTVSTGALEVRWEIGRFARSKRYEVTSVSSVSAEPVPDEDGPRDDFGLLISCVQGVEHVGEGMDAREAEHIAAAIESRLNPRSWWRDEEASDRPVAGTHMPAAVTTLSAGHFQIAAPRARTVTLGLAGIGACVVLTGTLLAALFGEERSRPGTPQAAPTLTGSPVADEFAVKRTFASATTAQSLISAGAIAVGLPRCTGRANWTEWTCRARARVTAGPSTGRIRTYVCRSTAAGGARCVPARARTP